MKKTFLDELYVDAVNCGMDCRNFSANIQAASRADENPKGKALVACIQAKGAAQDLLHAISMIEMKIVEA